MIRANELRIGNLVWEDYGGYYEVLMVSPNSVDLVKPLMSISGRYLIEQINPILLTEEWLLKLGFNKFKNYNDFSRKGVIIHGRKRGFVLRKSVPVIKYVHQLQNLYFALTGEELTMEA